MLADNSLAGKKDSFFTKTIVVWFGALICVGIFIVNYEKQKS